jgi:hypothetical protein
LLTVRQKKKNPACDIIMHVQAVERIARRYPDFMGAVIALNMRGEFGAACHGLGKKFRKNKKGGSIE